MAAARPWFEDGPYKQGLLTKIATNSFHICIHQDVPAKVIKLIYAGYKVIYPTGVEENVNPNTTAWKEVTAEEYEALVGPYLEREHLRNAAIEEKKRQEAEDLAKLKAFQASCQHEDIFVKEEARAAGFSSEDFHCRNCDKFLRCSMSTAYETDPKDIIGDWPWFLRYCYKTYDGYVPKMHDYDVVVER